MASKDELSRIVGKLLSDSGYRARFSANPQGAAGELNATLSPGQMDMAGRFRGADNALKNMAEQALKDNMYVTWG
jgi:hypothetical protein